MKAAAEEHKWPLDFGSIALLWRGGCIIRAVFLERIKEAFAADPKLENLLLARYFLEATARPRRRGGTSSLRRSIWAYPRPPFPPRWPTMTAIARARLPANLLQAQRDYFGAHTYQRLDRPGVFHSDWLRMRKEP